MGISNIKITVKAIICQRNWLFDSVSDITTDKLDIVQNLTSKIVKDTWFLFILHSLNDTRWPCGD